MVDTLLFPYMYSLLFSSLSRDFRFRVEGKRCVSMGKKGGNQINSFFYAAAAKVRPLPWESERVDTIFMLFIVYIETGLF